MLCGAFVFSGRPSADLAVVRNIAGRFRDAPMTLIGPLALACGPPAAAGSADGAHCVFEGRLHRAADPADPPEQARAGAEAVLHGYARSGTAILKELRGSYSFALWDESRNQGILACDPLSTRQWFTWRGSGYLLFAAELRDLLALVPTRPGPDHAGLLTWLAVGHCPLGVTL
jgi:hypothetical protein